MYEVNFWRISIFLIFNAFCVDVDKFAALWPFLGICAEVVILCVIIFLFERKQAKRLEKEVEKEEADFMWVPSLVMSEHFVHEGQKILEM